MEKSFQWELNTVGSLFTDRHLLLWIVFLDLLHTFSLKLYHFVKTHRLFFRSQWTFKNECPCNTLTAVTCLLCLILSLHFSLRCTTGWMSVCWSLQRKLTETWATFRVKLWSTTRLRLKSRPTRRDWITSVRFVCHLCFVWCPYPSLLSASHNCNK